MDDRVRAVAMGTGGEDAFTPVPLAIGPLPSGALPSWEATGTTHLAPGMVPPRGVALQTREARSHSGRHRKA